MGTQGRSLSIVRARHRKWRAQMIGEPQPKVLGKHWERGDSVWAISTISWKQGAVQSCCAASRCANIAVGPFEHPAPY
eukprot:1767226-Amphidinium_carterae.1